MTEASHRAPASRVSRWSLQAATGVLAGRAFLLAAAVMALLASCSEGNPDTSWEDPSEAASQLASALRRYPHSDLSRRFHYPPEMSRSERENDRANVESGLALLLREFGAVEDLELTANPEALGIVGVGGGFLPYWNQFPEQYSATFRARFSTEGAGFVRFVLSKRQGRWVLKSLNFGLPLARPGAAERIHEVLGLLRANPDRKRSTDSRDA